MASNGRCPAVVFMWYLEYWFDAVLQELCIVCILSVDMDVIVVFRF